MSRRLVAHSTLLEPEVVELLKDVSRDTRIPQAAIIRELLTYEAVLGFARKQGYTQPGALGRGLRSSLLKPSATAEEIAAEEAASRAEREAAE